MEAIESRYEWRVWGASLDEVSRRIRELSECHGVRDSLETYLLSATTSEVNPKVRDGLLDIKVLREVRDGFERWEPVAKQEFPVTAAFLRKELFARLGDAERLLERTRYTLPQFRDELIAPDTGLAAVGVRKRRMAYTVNGCIAEVAEVTVEGIHLRTASVESSDLGALVEARRLAGLDRHRNLGYPRAIKEAIGWGTDDVATTAHRHG